MLILIIIYGIIFRNESRGDNGEADLSKSYDSRGKRAVDLDENGTIYRKHGVAGSGSQADETDVFEGLTLFVFYWQ